MLVEILLIIVVLIYGLHRYVSRKFHYFEERNIPFMQPKPLFGNIYEIAMQKTDFLTFDRKVYNFFKGHKLGGYFEASDPTLWIQDPYLIKLILVKDFDHFLNRKSFGFDDDPIFGSTMFGSRGQYWRELRAFNSPAFSSGKMKKMFHPMTACDDNCIAYMKKLAESGEPAKMKDIFGRLTVDVVASAAYGLQINSFEDPNAEFPKMADKLVNPGASNILVLLLFVLAPKLAKYFNISPIPKEPIKFLTEVTLSTVDYREKNKIRGNDFLQLLSDARKGELEREEDDDETDSLMHKKSKLELSDTELVAQGFQFFFAGYETISNFLTFFMYELALNQDIQDRLRDEVNRIVEKHQGVCYAAVQEMEYMDMVISEVQRIHPALTRIERECVKEYKVPGIDLVIEKGINVAVNVAGLGYDPDYFPDPEKFDPERFSKEEKNKRNPYVFLPFGAGPRNCVGMRFALIEIKSVVAKIVSSMRINICEKTVIPPQLTSPTGIIKVKDGLWLKIENL